MTTEQDKADALERVIANSKGYACKRERKEYLQNEVDCMLLRACLAPVAPIEQVDVDTIAEQVFISMQYTLEDNWQELKDRWIGDDKPSNCWKGVYATCMKIAGSLTSLYAITETAHLNALTQPNKKG